MSSGLRLRGVIDAAADFFAVTTRVSPYEVSLQVLDLCKSFSQKKLAALRKCSLAAPEDVPLFSFVNRATLAFDEFKQHNDKVSEFNKTTSESITMIEDTLLYLRLCAIPDAQRALDKDEVRALQKKQAQLSKKKKQLEDWVEYEKKQLGKDTDRITCSLEDNNVDEEHYEAFVSTLVHHRKMTTDILHGVMKNTSAFNALCDLASASTELTNKEDILMSYSFFLATTETPEKQNQRLLFKCLFVKSVVDFIQFVGYTLDFSQGGLSEVVKRDINDWFFSQDAQYLLSCMSRYHAGKNISLSKLCKCIEWDVLNTRGENIPVHWKVLFTFMEKGTESDIVNQVVNAHYGEKLRDGMIEKVQEKIDHAKKSMSGMQDDGSVPLDVLKNVSSELAGLILVASKSSVINKMHKIEQRWGLFGKKATENKKKVDLLVNNSVATWIGKFLTESPGSPLDVHAQTEKLVYSAQTEKMKAALEHLNTSLLSLIQSKNRLCIFTDREAELKDKLSLKTGAVAVVQKRKKDVMQDMASRISSDFDSSRSQLEEVEKNIEECKKEHKKNYNAAMNALYAYKCTLIAEKNTVDAKINRISSSGNLSVLVSSLETKIDDIKAMYTPSEFESPKSFQLANAVLPAYATKLGKKCLLDLFKNNLVYFHDIPCEYLHDEDFLVEIFESKLAVHRLDHLLSRLSIMMPSIMKNEHLCTLVVEKIKYFGASGHGDLISLLKAYQIISGVSKTVKRQNIDEDDYDDHVDANVKKIEEKKRACSKKDIAEIVMSHVDEHVDVLSKLSLLMSGKLPEHSGLVDHEEEDHVEEEEEDDHMEDDEEEEDHMEEEEDDEENHMEDDYTGEEGDHGDEFHNYDERSHGREDKADASNDNVNEQKKRIIDLLVDMIMSCKFSEDYKYRMVVLFKKTYYQKKIKNMPSSVHMAKAEYMFLVAYIMKQRDPNLQIAYMGNDNDLVTADTENITLDDFFSSDLFERFKSSSLYVQDFMNHFVCNQMSLISWPVLVIGQTEGKPLFSVVEYERMISDYKGTIVIWNPYGFDRITKTSHIQLAHI